MKINRDKHRLTQEQLMTMVRYEPETGLMYRIRAVIPKTGRVVTINKLVNGSNNRGYFWINIERKMYLVHRLVFLYMTGNHPVGEVDHINGDRKDNRWVNLRDSNAAANSRNQGVRRDSTSGVRGVTYSQRSSKWIARISDAGTRISLGYFVDFEDAVLARREAEDRLGYHENHGRRKSWEV